MSETTTILSDAATAAAAPTANNPQQPGAASAPSINSNDFRSFVGDDGKFVSGWTDHLPDAHKPYAATLGKFPSPLDMAAGYANLEKRFGEKIAPPGADAKPEDWAKWRSVVGAPDKPEGYALKAPEKMPEGVAWDQASADKLAAIAHKHALPPGAVQDLMALSMELEGGKLSAGKQKLEGYVQEQTKALKDQWGEKYDSNIQSAVKAAMKLGVDLKDPELGSNAKVIEAMHKASLLMNPDVLTEGGPGTASTNAEQITTIRKSDDYQGKNGPDAQQRAAARIAALSNQRV